MRRPRLVYARIKYWHRFHWSEQLRYVIMNSDDDDEKSMLEKRK